MARTWGFLTNHAHVLVQIARNSRSTVREIALATGITERAAHAVLSDLRLDGILSVTREGRRNVYQINAQTLMSRNRWGATDMEIPQPLIDATIRGLAQVASAAAATA